MPEAFDVFFLISNIYLLGGIKSVVSEETEHDHKL